MHKKSIAFLQKNNAPNLINSLTNNALHSKSDQNTGWFLPGLL